MIAAVNNQARRGPQPGSNSQRQSLVTAKEAWGDDLEEWVATLAMACDRSSQNLIAKRMNYSPSVISAVLNRSYKGAYSAVEKTVRGHLLAETLECPVLGELRQHICLEHQKRAVHLNPTSAARVQLAKACRGGCVHSRLTNTKEADHAE
jgi:hypothetical protein